ncbi:hypothetical protein AB870_01065 [Pandoraea faecigallinarum]|uniref:Uncharacterized protein n=1 Tax=Pandoraea faecigallinarum TaxID=656179 RepID=A0A0H3WNU4_9BURK|nr:hypothetical protein [Pandoraea faecigallinarum]AKM29020.1 hypothetical protein AB870_01065 [Pandoraea faecigallinarum]
MSDMNDFNRPGDGIWHIVESLDPPPEFDFDTNDPTYDNYLFDEEQEYVGSRRVVATARNLDELVQRILEIGTDNERGVGTDFDDFLTDDA